MAHAVEDYLSKAFNSGHDLVKDMAQSQLVLSGSRALAFFYENAENTPAGVRPCHEDSDWDFYTAGSAQSFGNAIKILQQAGVVFPDIYQELHIAMQPGFDIHVGVSTVRKWDLCSWTLRQDESRLCLLIKNIARIVERNLHLHCIRISLGPRAGTLSVHQPNPRNIKKYDFAGPHLIVLKGLNLRTRDPVQLIAKMGCSPLQLIFQFHSSIVQGFITGFAAVHPYYKLTIEGKSYFWEHNTQAPVSARKACRKYEARGYNYIQHQKVSTRDPILRSVHDLESKIIPTHIDPSPESLMEQDLYLRYRSLQMIFWEEGDKSTELRLQQQSDLAKVVADIQPQYSKESRDIFVRYVGIDDVKESNSIQPDLVF